MSLKISNVDKYDNTRTNTKQWTGVFVKPKTDKLVSENITITNSTFKGYEVKLVTVSSIMLMIKLYCLWWEH